MEHVLNKLYTLHKHTHTKDGVRVQNTVMVLLPNHKLYYMSITMLKKDLGTGDLCNNIGLVGLSAKWSYVTASPSHHDQAIPILSPLLFMHVGHPYIPLFKIRRNFDLLVSPPFLSDRNPSIHVYAHIIMYISILSHIPFPFSTLISPL